MTQSVQKLEESLQLVRKMESGIVDLQLSLDATDRPTFGTLETKIAALIGIQNELERVGLYAEKVNSVREGLVGLQKIMVRHKIHSSPFIPSPTYFQSLKVEKPGKSLGQSISKPPGFTLLKLTALIFSKKTLEQLIVPIFVDMREEYYEALLQNDLLKARLVHLRGICSFLKAIGMDRAFAFVSFFIKAWKSVN